MIAPRIKPRSFFLEEAMDELVAVRPRKAKLEGYMQILMATARGWTSVRWLRRSVPLAPGLIARRVEARRCA